MVFNAWKGSSAQLEGIRQNTFIPLCSFAFGLPSDCLTAAEELRSLALSIEEHEADLNVREAGRRELELFQVWNRILTAKADVERAKERPLSYHSWDLNGSRITFGINEPLEEEVAGQPRRVVAGEQTILIGEVESIDAKSLTLYIIEQYQDGLPGSGKLVFDVVASQKAIRRQNDALDAVRFQRAVRSELRTYLSNPTTATPPSVVSIDRFVQPKLDDAKKKAVEAAVGTDGFLLVQGPPGTGKTTFIAEVVLQYLERNPNARILLTSQTHVALDNAAERIKQLSEDIKILRLGLSSDQKVAPAVKDLLLPAQMEQWKREVLPRGEEYLSSWSAEHGVPRHELKVGRALKQFVQLSNEAASLKERLTELRKMLPDEVPAVDGSKETSEKKKRVERRKPEPEDVAALRDDIDRLDSDLKQRLKDREQVAEELKHVEPLAGEILESSQREIEDWVRSLIPKNADVDRFLDLLDLRADWELRFGRTKDFQPALIASARFSQELALVLLASGASLTSSLTYVSSMKRRKQHQRNCWFQCRDRALGF